MPEHNYKEWDFLEGEDNTKIFNNLLEAIQTYGFEYQNKMKDFDNLLEAYEKLETGIFYHRRDRYLPIFYYMQGDKQAGLKAIDEAIERQKEPFDESTLPQFNDAEEVITIVGSEMSEVDPLYLEFAERYKQLS